MSGARFIVWDSHAREQVGKPLATRRAASRKADRLDHEYGAYRYQVRPLAVSEAVRTHAIAAMAAVTLERSAPCASCEGTGTREQQHEPIPGIHTQMGESVRELVACKRCAGTGVEVQS